MKLNKIFPILISLLLIISGCSTVSKKEEYLPMEDTILCNKISWNTSEVLFEVPITALDGVQGSELYKFQNYLLNTYYTYDSSLKESFYYVDLISIQTGERLYQKVFSNMTLPELQILDDYVVVKDIDKKLAYVLDTTLSSVNEYTLDSNNFVFDSKLEKVYVFTEENGIECFTLDTQEKTNLFENARTMQFSETGKDYVAFTYIDVNTLRKKGGMLNLNTGDIEVFELEESPRDVEYENGTWFVELYGDLGYVLGDNSDFKLLQVEKVDSVSLYPKHILIKTHNDSYQTVLTIYDLDGNYISSVELVDTLNPLTYDMVWLEQYNGYLFTLMSQEDAMDRLFFWDLSVVSEGESVIIKDLKTLDEVPSGSIVSKELYERAKDISKTYGMKVLIADQCDSIFPEHRADLLVNEEDIEIALNTLETTFASYPKGFFDQLKHDSYGDIEIQLVGTLEKDTSTEDVTYIAGGLVYAEESKLVMVLDARGTFGEINKPLQQTIYHEFSHLIDRKLAFRNKYYENQAYSEEDWNALNPEGFKYNDSYYGVLDSRYADYFIDQYACSNATEDRARIMEYAAMGRHEVFKREGIFNKWEYYCKSIRDGFDTTEWEEKTVWEKVLE